eukprot:TRINITY_DN45_c0_g2_i3.p2 TRINITY_DN45_c0_g2~~TRINITY_DN45_c0_g2_i3.p2  ORF type:complete len:381 (+),score=126.24 TRINITY_DN45_c0_g2_i3:72-1214(+)
MQQTHYNTNVQKPSAPSLSLPTHEAPDKWTKEDVMIDFNVSDSLRREGQLEVEHMVFRNTPEMRRFIAQWRDDVANYHWLSDEPSTQKADGSRFLDHRHDQALPQPSRPRASALPPADDQINRLQCILSKYEVTIADVNDLVVLQDYEIVFVADDSGSMQLSSMPTDQRVLGGANTTRWDEMKQTVQQVAEIACCLDHDGIDLYFLNRNPIYNITSSDDARFAAAFAAGPSGSTPLTETVRRVVAEKGGTEKPVLMLIATDGEPNDGPEAFKSAIRKALKCSAPKFKFQILACTEDDSSVAWLNEFDDATDGIDVTDDYHSERAEVLAAGRVTRFRRSDWVVKALLGPILKKYDELDQPAAGRGKASFSDKEDTSCCILM